MPAPRTASHVDTAAFCRGCGYSLRGLPGGNCPECGRGFDLSDRRTFAHRPPRARLRWWAWRIGILALVLTLTAGGEISWRWWGWHREQPMINAVRGAGGRVAVERVARSRATKFLPKQWAFLRDRAVSVILRDGTTLAVDRLDLGILAHVRTLVLVNCGLADPMLAQLRGMTNLQSLDLGGNPRLDGTGLRHLAGCHTLVDLDLGTTGLTDAGLAEVGRLTALKSLGIGDTPVTDAGMGHLVGLTRLTDLGLRRTAVTDAGLVRLRGLLSLRNLRLYGTKVTEQGRRDLLKAMPNLRILD